MSRHDDELRTEVGRQLERHRRYRPAGPIGLIVTGGTVGLLLVVPLLLGAYGGRWLDIHLAGYSVHWTVSCILLGLGLGAYNVYRFLKGLFP